MKGFMSDNELCMIELWDIDDVISTLFDKFISHRGKVGGVMSRPTMCEFVKL